MQGLCLDVGGMPHVAFTGAGVVGIAAAEAGDCCGMLQLVNDCYWSPKPRREDVSVNSASRVVLCAN